MVIVWVIVAVFAGDDFGVMAAKDEYKTLVECQASAALVEQLSKTDNHPAQVFCVAKESRTVL
jgi:hypothetical protein